MNLGGKATSSRCHVEGRDFFAPRGRVRRTSCAVAAALVHREGRPLPRAPTSQTTEFRVGVIRRLASRSPSIARSASGWASYRIRWFDRATGVTDKMFGRSATLRAKRRRRVVTSHVIFDPQADPTRVGPVRCGTFGCLSLQSSLDRRTFGCESPRGAFTRELSCLAPAYQPAATSRCGGAARN